MIDRIENKAQADETPLGLMPKHGGLDLTGLDITKGAMDELFSIDKNSWKDEIKDIEKFYSGFGDRIPAELSSELKKLKGSLDI